LTPSACSTSRCCLSHRLARWAPSTHSSDALRPRQNAPPDAALDCGPVGWLCFV
jgi:hypothetical protein